MYRIGIDLGGTNIAAAVVNDEFKIVKKLSVPTLAQRDAALIMDDMAQLCRDVCREAGIAIEDIDAIGIASPGVANHDTGAVEYACNLPFRKFPICRELSDRLGVMTSGWWASRRPSRTRTLPGWSSSSEIRW